MLHVLFILLKILGILLLLLVGVLLLVLLAPLRYSFKLEKEEQVSPEFSVRVTWLCWLFYFAFQEIPFDFRQSDAPVSSFDNQIPSLCSWP